MKAAAAAAERKAGRKVSVELHRTSKDKVHAAASSSMKSEHFDRLNLEDDDDDDDPDMMSLDNSMMSDFATARSRQSVSDVKTNHARK